MQQTAIRDEINLNIALDPYCALCRSRNNILRLHNRAIHEDREAPDFFDDAALWNCIYPEEMPTK